MNYYIIYPEVPGELGFGTSEVSDVSTPNDHLEFLLDYWPCDEIIQSNQYFAVSDGLRASFERNRISGIRYYRCTMGKSSYYKEGINAPPMATFWGIRPIGKAGIDDFGIDAELRLIASERVVAILSEFYAESCGVSDYVVGR